MTIKWVIITAVNIFVTKYLLQETGKNAEHTGH